MLGFESRCGGRSAALDELVCARHQTYCAVMEFEADVFVSLAGTCARERTLENDGELVASQDPIPSEVSDTARRGLSVARNEFGGAGKAVPWQHRRACQR